MKKRVGAALLCLLWLLAWAAPAESTWTQARFASVTAALASDEPSPVPGDMRIQPSRDLHAGKARRELFPLLLLSTDAQDMRENYGRTDAALLCLIHRDTGAVRVITLPVEAQTQLSGLPGTVALRYAACFGGPLLTAQTVNELLGVGVKRYCAVNDEAFACAVDALGGVTLTLSESEGDALGLAQGAQRLSGEQALRYVRLRRGDGTPRPQKLLEAVYRQMLEGRNVDALMTMADTILPFIDTNLTGSDVMDILFALCEQETLGAYTPDALPDFSEATVKQFQRLLQEEAGK